MLAGGSNALMWWRMTFYVESGGKQFNLYDIQATGCPKKVAFTLLSHCCLLLILPVHFQQIRSSETNRWKSKSKFLGNPVLQERTNEYHRKHIALYVITLKTSTNTEFGVFGRSWARIWARQIWSSGVSLKRSLPDFPIGLRTKNQLCAIWMSKKGVFVKQASVQACFSLPFSSYLFLFLLCKIWSWSVFSYLWWAFGILFFNLFRFQYRAQQRVAVYILSPSCVHIPGLSMCLLCLCNGIKVAQRVYYRYPISSWNTNK